MFDSDCILFGLVFLVLLQSQASFGMVDGRRLIIERGGGREGSFSQEGRGTLINPGVGALLVISR